MNIPTDINIESTIAAAESYARASNHALVWHLVQQLQQLRAPLHTGAERQAAFNAADALYLHLPRASETALLDDAAYSLIERVADYIENDPIVAEAAAFGAGAVETAIDQQGEYESLDDALYSYQITRSIRSMKCLAHYTAIADTTTHGTPWIALSAKRL